MEGMGMCRGTLNTYIKNATKQALVLLIESIEAKRAPGIFRVAKEYGNVDERTPPYRPEFQPMELIWARLKGGYDRAYEATGARNYAEWFAKALARPTIQPSRGTVTRQLAM